MSYKSDSLEFLHQQWSSFRKVKNEVRSPGVYHLISSPPTHWEKCIPTSLNGIYSPWQHLHMNTQESLRPPGPPKYCRNVASTNCSSKLFWTRVVINISKSVHQEHSSFLCGDLLLPTMNFSCPLPSPCPVKNKSNILSPSTFILAACTFQITYPPVWRQTHRWMSLWLLDTVLSSVSEPFFKTHVHMDKENSALTFLLKIN